MIGHCNVSDAFTLLCLLMGASFLHLSSPNLITTVVDVESPQRNGQAASGERERRDDARQPMLKEEAEEDDLFEDVDPKTLAAVLLEALNHSQVERRREGGKNNRMEKGMRNNGGEIKKEEIYTGIRTTEIEDRDTNSPQELKLLMATQGNDKDIEEEEERKKAQKEEEMTEKVISHTTSQTVEFTSLEDNGKGAAPQTEPTSPEQGSNEEEEQLSPVELKSLETMMKEFPSLNTATKREGDSKKKQGEKRGYSKYNDVIPINKDSNLAMSKKKLKWQEETQKALNVPTFGGGNFLNDVAASNYDTYAAQSQPLADKTEMENAKKEEKEDEEVLSPEEEEARAKEEQEEMRRQAVEAQKAKMEEERLADIASDMLLLYMVKQNGNKKYSSSVSSAVEDKRSNEVLEVTEEDDIDPQTIDKLIEISNKLHLPADDVVEIISDVEKKKKKNTPPEKNSPWHKSTSLTSSVLSASNSLSSSEVSDDKKNFPFSKQPSSPVGRLQTWFRDKAPAKSHDHWSKTAKPLLGVPNLRPKPQTALLNKQDLWLKSPVSFWTGYRSYPHTYPSLHQPYLDRYPIYFPSPPRPKFYHYIHKPAVDDIYTLPSKHRYKNWVLPWLRKPVGGIQQMPYFTSNPFSMYSWTYQPVSIPKTPTFPQVASISSQRKQFYYPTSATAAKGSKDHYVSGKQTDDSTHKVLQKYIEMILKKRLEMGRDF